MDEPFPSDAGTGGFGSYGDYVGGVGMGSIDDESGAAAYQDGPLFPVSGPDTSVNLSSGPLGPMEPLNCSDHFKMLQEMDVYRPPSQLVVPVVYCVICVIGLIGNGLVMFVIFGSKEMAKTVANIYIWNLAVADTLFLITLPFSATQRFMLSWPFGGVMCKIVEAVKYLNYFASIFFLTAMSIDRYIAVQYVVTSSRWRTSRNTFFVCAAIWLVSLVMVTPLLIYTRMDEGVCALVFNTNDMDYLGSDYPPPDYRYRYEDCDRGFLEELDRFGRGSGEGGLYDDIMYNDPTLPDDMDLSNLLVLCKHQDSKTFHVFLIFTTVIGFVIPFLIITVCYVLIVVRLLQPSETRSRSKQAERTRRKVTRMVVALVITFFICWLPFYVWHLMQIKGVMAKQGVCHNIRDFTFCLGFANSCLNPILYTFLGHNFQERLRKSIANSIRSFSFTTFTKYTTNTMSRAETPAHSKKLDASNSEPPDMSAKLVQPLTQIPEGKDLPLNKCNVIEPAADKLLEEHRK